MNVYGGPFLPRQRSHDLNQFWISVPNSPNRTSASISPRFWSHTNVPLAWSHVRAPSPQLLIWKVPPTTRKHFHLKESPTPIQNARFQMKHLPLHPIGFYLSPKQRYFFPQRLFSTFQPNTQMAQNRVLRVFLLPSNSNKFRR